MSRGVSRSRNVLVWQKNDFNNLIQYKSDLRSRIYKALLEKDTEQINFLQLKIVKCPLIICLALKQQSLLVNFQLNSFELGYLSLFFESACRVLCLFFDYYRGERSRKLIYILVDKIKCRNLNCLMQVHVQYLYLINNFSFFQHFKIDRLSNFFNYFESSRLYGFTVDLSNCIYYIDPSEILIKYQLTNLFQFLNIFNKGVLIECIRCFTKFSYLLLLQKDNPCLVCQFMQLLTLYYSYEISVMLTGRINLSEQKKQGLIIVSHINTLIVLSAEPSQLCLWRKCLLSLLKSNGVKVSNKILLKKTLSIQGLSFKYFFISLYDKFYQDYFVAKPSLQYQFILIKRISSILISSTSNPLFIIIVRLNKLLLAWSFFYRFHNVKKVCALLDYLIYMKFQSFIESRTLFNLYNTFNIESLISPRSTVITFVKKVCNIPVISISSQFYYKHYLLIKLSWLLSLSCSINLREAV